MSTANDEQEIIDEHVNALFERGEVTVRRERPRVGGTAWKITRGNDPVDAVITIKSMPDRKVGLIMRTIKEERARRISKLTSLATESILHIIRDETHIEPYNEADLSRFVEARVSAALQNVIAEELFDRAVRYRHKNGKPSPETLAAVSKSRFDPDSL